MKKPLFLLLVLFLTNTFSQEIKFGKVSQEELEEKVYPLDSTAEASYLYKKRRTYFEYDSRLGFRVVSEIHQRIKIYTKEGFNQATKLIAYYKPETGEQERISGLKANTYYLENGKIVKLKLSKKDVFDTRIDKYQGQKKITYPGVKEGAILELKYKTVLPFTYIRPVVYQFGIPVKELEIQIEIPEYYMFNKRSKGYFSLAVKKSTKNGKIDFGPNDMVDYVTNINLFEGKNIPALKDDEPYSGNINNYKGGLEFELAGTRFPNSMIKNYATSWEDISKQIYKSPFFGGQLKSQNFFKDDLDALLQDAKSDDEKISLIYNYVKSKVVWNDYLSKYTDNGIKKAYKEGKGNVADINLLLTSMLRYANLDANPVLVSTKSNGIPLFPTLNGYNYVITKVNLSNSHILLDATEKYAVENVLPTRCLNWVGREVFDNGASNIVNLIGKTPTKETNTLYVNINDDLSVNGMLRTSLADFVAYSYRKRKNVLKEEELIEEIEEDYNVEVEDFKVQNKDNIYKNILRSFKFDAEDVIEELNGKLYITPLFFLAETDNVFKAKERSYPVDFILPWQDKTTASMNIPEGYTIESIPEAMAIGLPNNFGVFKYQVVSGNGKIKVTSILQMNENLIGPQYYDSLKEFYKQLVAKQIEKIVLVKA